MCVTVHNNISNLTSDKPVMIPDKCPQIITIQESLKSVKIQVTFHHRLWLLLGETHWKCIKCIGSFRFSSSGLMAYMPVSTNTLARSIRIFLSITNILIVNCASLCSEEISPTIVGGVEATPYEFPWIVELRKEPNTPNSRHSCGGSIVNEHFIVTAAHCALDRPNNYEIVAGEHNLTISEGFEQRSRVVEIIVHPNYDEWNKTTNIYESFKWLPTIVILTCCVCILQFRFGERHRSHAIGNSVQLHGQSPGCSFSSTWIPSRR